MSTPRPPPSPEALERYANGFNASSNIQYFGVRVTFPRPDLVRVVMDPVKPEHRGGMGTAAVNGGILAAMFDLAIGCTPALLDPTKRTATLQLSMSFERPVLGDRFTIDAQVNNAGETTCFSTAVLFDQHGVECARCTGVARLSKQQWAQLDSPAQ